MKGSLKSFVTGVLSAAFVVTALSAFSYVRADVKTYEVSGYGEYPFFENAAEAGAFVREKMLNRETEFTLYVAEETEDGNDFCKAIVDQALAYDPSMPFAGDSLSKNYSKFNWHFWKFENAYDNNGTREDLLKINYDFAFYTSIEEENALRAEVDKVLISLNLSSKSSIDKFTTIYNWITSNISYDYDNANLPKYQRDLKSYTAYNAMIKKTAVCQGVATLFYNMLLKSGIDTRIVCSKNHCWNIVLMDGKYYYSDVTWDLGVAPSDYGYFLKGYNTSFAKEHDLDADTVQIGYEISPDDYNAAPAAPATTAPAETKGSDSVRGFASRLYTVVLGREAEADGLNYWAGELEARHLNGAQAAKSFLYSDEFINKKVSDKEYLRVLYGTFFNREMDEGGMNYWLSVLNDGTSRDAVLEGFINSTEWDTVCKTFGIDSGAYIAPAPATPSVDPKIMGFATRLYTTALAREAEADGLEFWSTALASKSVTGTDAAKCFVFCDEFINANISNGEYVTRLYKLFMDRDPDQGGYDYWVSELNGGADRLNVFYGFTTSPEFARICDECGIAR